MSKRNRRWTAGTEPKPTIVRTPHAAYGEMLQALEVLPDSAFVTDAECEALTRLSRTSLWRLEQSEPLLKSVNMGPKRKVRSLGNVREFIRRRIAAADSAVVA